MRLSVLRRILWTFNALVGFAVLAVAYWAIFSEADIPSLSAYEILNEVEATAPTLPPQPEKQLSVSEIESVFSRSFIESMVSAPEAPEVRPPSVGPPSAIQPELVKPRAEIPRLPPLDSLIQVVAIFHDRDPFLCSAVIVSKKRPEDQQLYWHGETLKDVQAKIVAIEERRVRFAYDGRTVDLEITVTAGTSVPEPLQHTASEPVQQPVAQPAQDDGPIDPLFHRVVPRSEVMEVMQKPLEFLKGIRYTLVQEEGKVVGFKVTGINQESIVGKYGLENNDVIIGVNGKAIDATFNPFLAVTSLMNSPKVRLKVRRKNMDLDFTYEIK